MADDFDIDKFLSESFSAIEKKFLKTKKEAPSIKKVDKLLNKIKNTITDEPQTQYKFEPQKSNIKISDYNFDKVIDNRIYQEIVNTSSKKIVDLDSLLKPLFPNEKVFESEFKKSDKSFLLDKYIGSTKKRNMEDTLLPPQNNSKNLKINKFKKFKESEIISKLKNDKNLKFSDIFPIHTYWKQYIANLLNMTTQADTIYNKMLKCDLHGAIIEVVESKNKNLIGIKGINLLETRRSFNVINDNDEVKTILKKGNIFRIDLPYEQNKFSVSILGDNFTYKAVERTKAKYKNKYNL